MTEWNGVKPAREDIIAARLKRKLAKRDARIEALRLKITQLQSDLSYYRLDYVRKMLQTEIMDTFSRVRFAPVSVGEIWNRKQMEREIELRKMMAAGSPTVATEGGGP